MGGRISWLTSPLKTVANIIGQADEMAGEGTAGQQGD